MTEKIKILNILLKMSIAMWRPIRQNQSMIPALQHMRSSMTPCLKVSSLTIVVPTGPVTSLAVVCYVPKIWTWQVFCGPKYVRIDQALYCWKSWPLPDKHNHILLKSYGFLLSNFCLFEVLCLAIVIY